MSHILKTPQLFIIGAPKCGTTSLAGWLSEHPDVFMSVPKEPHYFNTDMNNRVVRDENEYLNIFRDKRAKILGEASTWYLFSKVAVANIERYCNTPKYIVMSRPPIDMVQSLYFHNKRTGAETAETIEEAWVLQQPRAQGQSIPKMCRDVRYLQYKEACSFGELTRRLFGTVPESRVLHVRLQDLSQDPRGTYLRVLTFLGLSDDGRDNFDRKNESREARYRTLYLLLRRLAPVKRLMIGRRSTGFFGILEKKTGKPDIAPDFLELLAKEFRNDASVMKELRLSY
jgi:hypothetical protein